MTDNKDCKSLTVYKTDIHAIGDAAYETMDENNNHIGVTTFRCNIGTSNIEKILLREILSLFCYSIIAVKDVSYDSHGNYIGLETIDFDTDMPFKEFMSLKRN